jgi:hypothetical protein
MKTTITLFLLASCLLFSEYAYSQRRAGFYGGLNFSSMKFIPSESNTGCTLPVLGGFGTRQISQAASLLYSVQYIEKGADFHNVNLRLKYLEPQLSMLVGATRDKGGPYLIAGFGIGMLISARGQVPDVNLDIIEFFQQADFNFNGGAGIRFSNFFIEGTYSSTVISVIREEFAEEAFNKGFQLKAGFSFNLR